ncbi:hypothetical protein [Gluconobacter sp. P5B12]
MIAGRAGKSAELQTAMIDATYRKVHRMASSLQLLWERGLRSGI